MFIYFIFVHKVPTFGFWCTDPKKLFIFSPLMIWYYLYKFFPWTDYLNDKYVPRIFYIKIQNGSSILFLITKHDYL